MAVPFFYQSGEQIKVGDRVRFHGEPAEIESVHDPVEAPDDSFVTTYGGGVMVVQPMIGRAFIDAPVTDYDDLQFDGRGSDLR